MSANRRFPAGRSARATIAALLALFAAATAVPAAAQAQPRLPASGVVVDASPLAALGARRVAAIVREAAARELTGVVATGPTRVVITHVITQSLVGGRSGTDYVEGYVDGPRGRTPILFAPPSNIAGAWYAPDIEERRLVVLGQLFANWARRAIEVR